MIKLAHIKQEFLSGRLTKDQAERALAADKDFILFTDGLELDTPRAVRLNYARDKLQCWAATDNINRMKRT
jgi:hypothetical protein